MPNPPVLVKPIPPQIVNEGAAFGPLNLNNFLQSPDEEGGPVSFQAELSDGRSLPTGLICTSSGTVSGITAVGTQGDYEIVVIAENASGTPVTANFRLTIKERIALETTDLIGDLKSRVWEALIEDLPIPEIGDLFNRPVTAVEVYYLLQRFATLTIWDVYNLDPPGEKHLLTLPGASEHYNVYDRGSCIVATPKDLFSHQRTLADSLQTAKAMAREIYKRDWVIEFAGFDKMARASWIEFQILADKHGKEVEILHYTPSEEDKILYAIQAKAPEQKIAPE